MKKTASLILIAVVGLVLFLLVLIQIFTPTNNLSVKQNPEATSTEIVHEDPVYPDDGPHPPIVRMAEDVSSVPRITFDEALVNPQD